MTALTHTRIIESFNRSFRVKWNTILVGGFEEPYYQPSHGDCPAEIRFTRDYARSALHEVAHWCISGENRRELPDYGYWYRPDGRNLMEQSEFFKVEVKPQALEMAFSERCGISFQVSCDNLHGENSGDEREFERQVRAQLESFRQQGFPERAHIFIEALSAQANASPPEQSSAISSNIEARTRNSITV